MPSEPTPAGDAVPQERGARRARRRSTRRAGAPARSTPEAAADPTTTGSTAAGYSGPPDAVAETAPTLDAAAEPTGGADRDVAAPRAARRSRRDPMERHWRELTGSGPSQVSLSAALRARDADQPTADELAAAERDVTVVHRNWTPTQ